jgi:hypothetical protein
MRWVQVLENNGFYEDEPDNGDLGGVDVVDTNASGEVTDVSEGFQSTDGGVLEVAEEGVPLQLLDLDTLDEDALGVSST